MRPGVRAQTPNDAQAVPVRVKDLNGRGLRAAAAHEHYDAARAVIGICAQSESVNQRRTAVPGTRSGPGHPGDQSLSAGVPAKRPGSLFGSLARSYEAERLLTVVVRPPAPRSLPAGLARRRFAMPTGYSLIPPPNCRCAERERTGDVTVSVDRAGSAYALGGGPTTTEASGTQQGA